ncbi:PD-(D/E)XK nuclease family protein [Psychroflexus sp. CAK1W]|uniref:PDDEXK-like family protein n=1 Tax=Psychroflexus curvus TaxID=2873595 RepID=UPI001CCB88BE|nr:PD-(D/E)XK nuclease family protein [Psychroflexus curvus]MBZ9628127.1 PD-(D/E)XK nuclease family protein [Psychroflexus curvus]
MVSTYCKNLIEKTNSILQKYHEIEKITGEKFNLFSILRKSEDELSHSRFIGNLLNPKGSHDQDSIYLNLFIETLVEKFEEDELKHRNKFESIISIDLNNAKCKTEAYIGKVDFKDEVGGSIDLIVTDNRCGFIIENKIWAQDQYKQLLRYSQAYPDVPIFYLSLFQDNQPAKNSVGNLKKDEDYFIISYENEISEWIEKCIKASATKPIIRESLRQYLFLIKKLTQQSRSKNMEKEIVGLLLNNEQNLDAFENLQKVNKEVKFEIMKTFVKNLNEEINLKYEGFDFVNNFKLKTHHDSFELQNQFLKNHNIKISFSFFHSSQKIKFGYGFSCKDFSKSKEPYISLINACKQFNGGSNSRWVFKKGLEYSNWEDLNHLKKYQFDKDYKNQVNNYFLNKIDEMITIAEEVEGKIKGIKDS